MKAERRQRLESGSPEERVPYPAVDGFQIDGSVSGNPTALQIGSKEIIDRSDVIALEQSGFTDGPYQGN